MIKKVLYIDLENQKYEIKSLTEITKYVGGLGVGLKLLLDHRNLDPIIFSIGPLNGFFPFASKTSIVFENEGKIEDLYLGGTLSSRIKFTGVDSIVIYGKAEKAFNLEIQDETVYFRSIDQDPDTLGLPGKKSVIKPIIDKYVLDNYFTTQKMLLEDKLATMNLRGITITGTRKFEIGDLDRYQELYSAILKRTNEISVEQGDYPSCSGCPIGCKESKIGELGGNVLVHSLVGCTYSEKIYSNIGIVFSCLNILGYDYTHEDIETLPILIKQVLQELT